MKIVIGISGATGAIYGIRLLEVLKECKNIEKHLIISNWGEKTIALETKYSLKEVQSLADVYHNNSNVGASIASGSFKTIGMVILPCSMKTLSFIANGNANNLLTRAADVTLKEGRKLVLVPRETPLNSIHLENMLKLSRAGVTMVPPMPAFYNKPQNLDDIINHFVGRILDCFGVELEQDLSRRWTGNEIDVG